MIWRRYIKDVYKQKRFSFAYVFLYVMNLWLWILKYSDCLRSVVADMSSFIPVFASTNGHELMTYAFLLM